MSRIYKETQSKYQLKQNDTQLAMPAGIKNSGDESAPETKH